MSHRARRSAYGLLMVVLVLLTASGPGARAQSADDGEFVPVTDAMLQAPAPEDWLMWRRTLDSWGYSPLDQINADNVGELRLAWSRGLHEGSQQGTPLAYGGVLYMPNPSDVIQAIDAATGDLLWEHRREVPEDINEYLLGSLSEVNRSLAIYAGTSSIRASTSTSSPSTQPPAGWCGRRRFSTTGRIPPTRRRDRSSPTERSSRGGAARRAVVPTRASSWPTTR